MNNIVLAIDAILYRKLEIVASLKGKSVEDYLSNFFDVEVSTPCGGLTQPGDVCFCH